MAQAGISLGEASVSAESFREQAEHRSASHDGRGGYRGDREDVEPAWSRSAISSGVRRGLVDLFA
jgi:flagellar hook-length control protein FliK